MPTTDHFPWREMLVFGWDADETGPATTINDHAKVLIQELRVGGVILMGRNVAGLTPAQVLALTSALQALAAQAGLPPLLIATDQEGGRVSRFGPPHFAVYPPAWEIGASQGETNAYDNYAALGREMKNVGVNWILAPVLDVNNNPKNPVIGNRSFGADPALVARMGAAAVRGLQDGAGVLACGKHFPGHGDTDIDSHLALPRIPHDRARLDSVELAPFKAAIEAGIGSIMTSHILFTAVDPALPATLSPAILQGILRQDLSYDGLIVTDDLDMKGVAATWGAPEAAVLAAVAGADMLLCCHVLETQRKIAAALDEAVDSGRIDEERVRSAKNRIHVAKARVFDFPS
jgi:beta-N-acetylhexosaminidase